VVTIIALLISLVVPMAGRAIESGRVTACAAKLRGLGQALFMYSLDNDDLLPPFQENAVIWDEAILSYLGNDYSSFECPGDPYGGSANPAAHPRTYACNGGAKYENGDLPFGGFDGQGPLAVPELRSRSGRVILLGERPGDSESNRGFVGEFPFSTLDTLPGTVHQRGKGGNYLFADMAVQYMTVEEAQVSVDTDYWYVNLQSP